MSYEVVNKSLTFSVGDPRMLVIIADGSRLVVPACFLPHFGVYMGRTKGWY